ncbi:MAG: Na/Pi cotransporter family protein [Clostridia bacterium]|nr:Na/Pi cotransporter family protein [Clostridia bacterium]
MQISNYLSLLGGLALFLYGMQMMSDGLEDAAGNKMKKILEKLTTNRFLGILVGAGITVAIQSSSATTVMVVGFVNSGMMTLRQAVWIIMGANIGTTVTGQLIALDVGMLAPLVAFLGVALIVFLKMPKVHHIGRIMAGLGILFIGMEMMSASMNPLRDAEWFVDIVKNFSNPLVGILVGALFTAIIQSSSASVGILQALAVSGVIGLPTAVYVLFGQNIGTCITALLASIGANKSAKRTTVIHLMFNISGTILFTLICMLTPFTAFMESITADPASQIANMHTVFNIVTTVLLIPFGNVMASLAVKILPDAGENMDEGELSLASLNAEYRIGGRTGLGATAVHIDLLRKEVENMVSLAGENVNLCYQVIIDKNTDLLPAIEQTEETIDSMNKEISQYISKILAGNHAGQNVASIEEYFLISGNVERIGDHAVNISDYIEVINRKSINFSVEAITEIKEMQLITKKAIDKVLNRDSDPAEWLSKIAAMEQLIDDMTKTYREDHLERMRKGLCSEEACVLFSELLIDFERIGDHVLNIAQSYSKIFINE